MPRSKAFTRGPEHNSGRRIAHYERQVRLEVEAQSFQPDPEPARPPRDRPVCLTTEQPATEILQLEAGPVRRGSGCLHTGLVKDQGLCQPSMEHGRENPVIGQRSESPTGPIIVAPVWKSQGWYLVLLGMLYKPDPTSECTVCFLYIPVCYIFCIYSVLQSQVIWGEMVRKIGNFERRKATF